MVKCAKKRIVLSQEYWETELKKYRLSVDRAEPGFQETARPGFSTRTNQLSDEYERTLESDLGAREVRQFLVELAAMASDHREKIALSAAWQREIALTCLVADILCSQGELPDQCRCDAKTAVLEEALMKTWAGQFPLDPRLENVALGPQMPLELGSAEELKRRWKQYEVDVHVDGLRVVVTEYSTPPDEDEGDVSDEHLGHWEGLKFVFDRPKVEGS